MTDTKRRLLVGVIKWIGAGIGVLGAYLLTLDGLAEWSWFVVITGTVAHVGAGLAALAAFLSGEPAKPEVTKPVKRLEPEFDSFDVPGSLTTGTKLEPAVVAPIPVKTGWKFSPASIAKLSTCHPDLIKVANRALQLSPYDFAVICGSRKLEEQKALVATGKSQTMNSRHIQVPSHAFDFQVYGDEGPTWQVEPYYIDVIRAIKRAALDLGIEIESGGDWKTLRDYGHVQLSHAAYPDRVDVGIA
jgi:peptidoglycan L-alanyl-D-glutamate endopeptidase CwlK